MTSIRGKVTVTKTEQIGFKCGLCHQNYKEVDHASTKEYTTEFDRKIDISDWPFSYRGYLTYFHPDGESNVNVDLCSKCFYQLRDVVKAMGGEIENDG